MSERLKRSMTFGAFATAVASVLSYLFFGDFSLVAALMSLVATTAAGYWLVFREAGDPPS